MKNIIGVLIILIGLVYKTIHDSNYENYSTAYALCILSIVIGLVILFNEFLSKYEMLIPSSFFLKPKKWIINFGKMMTVIALIVVVSILLIEMTTLTNQYVIKKIVMTDSVETVGKLEKEINVKLIGKFRAGKEKFVLISYDVNNERVVNSIKSTQLPDTKKEGDYIGIKYSKKYPNIFILE